MSESTSIKLADGTRDRLKALGEAKQRSANWLMKEAIEQYLTRQEAEEQFRRDAIESHEHYLATGLHVTHEEMEVWFEAVAKGENPPMPKPHK
jgi:predicted transcriptional regulator